MPHVPTLEGEAPKEKSFLVLQMGEGEGLPLPVGAQFLVVLDKNQADQILPVFLAEVAKCTGGFRLAFRCHCGKPGCNRVFKGRLMASGHHPQGKR